MINYPTNVLTRLRFQFCPKCQTPLIEAVISDDNIPRVKCPSCDWMHYISNAMGVNVIVKAENGIVALLPPGEPEEAPAAVPSGHVEYGESPENAAIREVYEETGLKVEISRCLGWYFEANEVYPGPILSFIFEAIAIGGHLRESEEGKVKIFPLNRFPTISPNRGGSQKAFDAFMRSSDQNQ